MYTTASSLDELTMVHSKDPHSYHQLHNQELANWEIRVLGLKKSNRRFDKIVITVMPFDQYTEITVFILVIITGDPANSSAWKKKHKHQIKVILQKVGDNAALKVISVPGLPAI